MDTSFVKKLKNQTFEDVLRSMITQFESAGSDSSKYPFVTLTNGSFVYSGIPVRIERIAQESQLVILSPERGLNGQDSLTYLSLRSISGLSLDNFRLHLEAITAAE